MLLTATWQALGFFLAKLDVAQRKYSAFVAFDRELLAIYLALGHFRWAVESKPFHVLTDHKLLLFIVFLTRGQLDNSAI